MFVQSSRSLRGDWLTQGPAIVEFERAFADVCEVPHAVAFSSGTAALHAAAFAAGVGPGDDVLTSAITFAASANCAAYMGATPIFADIERETWNVERPHRAGRADRAGTRAIVPVHFTGLPAPIAEIRSAVGQEVVIIEDAAHALGAHTEDEAVGACRHADMAVFSFHPVKAITTAEGGMVTTRNEAFRDRLTTFRNHGMLAAPENREEDSWLRQQVALGFNYRITDVQSSLGTSQLRKLEQFITRRNELAARYRDAFADVEQVELAPAPPEGVRHAYHLFVVRHTGGAEARRRLYHRLRERDILVQVHYLPVYLHPWYAKTYGYAAGLCSEAERYYAGSLTLPCFPALSDEEQEQVIDEVRRQAVRV